MNNFTFHNPTRLLFGKGMIEKLSTAIPMVHRIMITFGGGSVKQNGVYDQVIKALKDRDYIEFWGIEPNPTIETLREAIQIAKGKQVDFLLAVGGGSVIDGTKLISAGILYDGDPWELVQKGYYYHTVPMGTVLTLPPYQVACGIADTFVHVMEQYMTTTDQSRLMDHWAESILSTLVEIAPKIKEDPRNYDLMADFMLSATMGLNGFIAMGVTQDWATHMIGHELTALHGLTHGATLAIVLPGTLRTLRKQKEGKILQYGERVWGINSGTTEERVSQAIEKTEQFFQSLGLSTRLSQEKIGDTTITEIENRFNERNAAFGEAKNVTGSVAREILESCK